MSVVGFTHARYAMIGINPETHVVDVIVRTDDCCASQLKFMEGLIVMIVSAPLAVTVWGERVNIPKLVVTAALGRKPITAGGSIDKASVIEGSGTG